MIHSVGCHGRREDTQPTSKDNLDMFFEKYYVSFAFVLNASRAWVAELVDARDLKSLGPRGCVGSIPTPGTICTAESLYT